MLICNHYLFFFAFYKTSLDYIHFLCTFATNKVIYEIYNRDIQNIKKIRNDDYVYIDKAA